MSDRKGIGGRPREGVHAKKAPLNLRTDPELRARVEASAAQHKITLTKAVERLVRRGLEADGA
jgi:predicted HicB family RNase H-like nuclease